MSDFSKMNMNELNEHIKSMKLKLVSKLFDGPTEKIPKHNAWPFRSRNEMFDDFEKGIKQLYRLAKRIYNDEVMLGIDGTLANYNKNSEQYNLLVDNFLRTNKQFWTTYLDGRNYRGDIIPVIIIIPHKNYLEFKKEYEKLTIKHRSLIGLINTRFYNNYVYINYTINNTNDTMLFGINCINCVEIRTLNAINEYSALFCNPLKAVSVDTSYKYIPKGNNKFVKIIDITKNVLWADETNLPQISSYEDYKLATLISKEDEYVVISTKFHTKPIENPIDVFITPVYGFITKENALINDTKAKENNAQLKETRTSSNGWMFLLANIIDSFIEKTGYAKTTNSELVRRSLVTFSSGECLKFDYQEQLRGSSKSPLGYTGKNNEYTFYLEDIRNLQCSGNILFITMILFLYPHEVIVEDNIQKIKVSFDINSIKDFYSDLRNKLADTGIIAISVY